MIDFTVHDPRINGLKNSLNILLQLIWRGNFCIA